MVPNFKMHFPFGGVDKDVAHVIGMGLGNVPQNCTGVAMNRLAARGEVAAEMKVAFPALRKEISDNIRGWGKKKSGTRIRSATITLNHRFPRH